MTSIDSPQYWGRKQQELSEPEIEDTMDRQLHRLQVEYSATPDGDEATRSLISQQIRDLSEQRDRSEMDSFLTEWALDVTTSRRAAWNELARKGQRMLQCQQALGFRFDDMKKAIAAHGL